MSFSADLRTLPLSVQTFGSKFDVIIVDPPWEEYVQRAPGVGDGTSWTWQVGEWTSAERGGEKKKKLKSDFFFNFIPFHLPHRRSATLRLRISPTHPALSFCGAAIPKDWKPGDIVCSSGGFEESRIYVG